MPKIADIVDAVDLLRIDPVSVDEDRCVVVRNRNASCRRCMEACIADAITIERNTISIDPDACMNCGACASVCPDRALSMVEPRSSQILERARRTSMEEAGLTVIACSRRAAKGEGDPERFAEAPCLAHLDEFQLVSLASRGLDDIVLVDGVCETCRLGGASPAIDATVDSAATILDSVGAESMVTRTSSFPEEVLLPEGERARGSNRRGLARQTGSYMTKVVANVAQRTIEEKLGLAETQADARRRRIVTNGRMHKFEPVANYDLIDDMLALSDQEAIDESSPDGGSAPNPLFEGILDSRRFGDVRIDAVECTGCGLCVMFCPTKALSWDHLDETDDPDTRLMEFDASDCTQCHLCEDVCLRHCIAVYPAVGLSELFDPAPKLIEVPRH